MTTQDRAALRARCSRHLVGHAPLSLADELEATAAWCREHGVERDHYGDGALIRSFEAEMAERLGQRAAVFMPSGTMAQQIALRIVAERTGNPCFGMPATSHLELHEHHGYRHLHGLRSEWVGPSDGLVLAEHLAGVDGELASLLVELPLRELGGLLPTQQQLDELIEAAQGLGIWLHLDGARLGECRAHFGGTDLGGIAGAFDSVYLSLYKGLGGLFGCVLAGPEDFIEEARIWQRRHGGNLPQSTSAVAASARRLEESLGRMAEWVAQARRVAAALSEVPGVELRPNPPHTNMFHLLVDVDAERLMGARDRWAEQEGLWLFGGVAPKEPGERVLVELSLFEPSLACEPAEVARGLAAVLEEAANP